MAQGHTTDRTDERLNRPDPVNPRQQEVYLVLSEEERSHGFVRPVRQSYRHQSCGTITSMSLPIAETYAANPGFYGRTFCVQCGIHLPVGEFTWVDPRTKVDTGVKVGS